MIFFKKNLLMVLWLSWIIGIGGCGVEPRQASVEKSTAPTYGTTKGTFRHKWWNYYERGMSFADGQLWTQAEADFREALVLRDQDQLRARTYGMHFVDYFPHRELGIALFYQQRYDEAIREMEASIASEKSAKAEFYLDKARKVQIDAKGLDKNSPQIAVNFPSSGFLTNANSVRVKGIVSDDTFVSEIQVNKKDFRIDLSAQKIEFDVEVPLAVGENILKINAGDLSGKMTVSELRIVCDKSGPILNLDDPEPVQNSGGEYLINGYAYDMSGIKTIRVNNNVIAESPGSEKKIEYRLKLKNPADKVIVIAEDDAGNQTKAEIMQMPKPLGYAPQHAVVAGLKPATATGFFASSEMLLAADTAPRFKARGLPLSPRNIRRYRVMGKDYALIIGINQYDEWPHLKTAVNDATSLRDVLIRKYGFLKENIVLRTDKAATMAVLIQDMRQISANLTENDNLLIYFGGHGQIDSLSSDGYWIPSDGKLKDLCSWITHSSVRNLLSSEKVRGKNIMVIADSCYSGNLTRGGFPAAVEAEEDFQAKILELAYKKSRQIVTSGGNEPVSDSGRDNHSLFAYYFLKALEDNTQQVVDIESIMMTQIWKPVVDKGGQRPTVGRLKTPMDEDGQYVLILATPETTVAESSKEKPEPPKTAPDQKPATIAAAEPVQEKSGQPTTVTERKPLPVNALPDTSPPVLEIKGWDTERTVFSDKVYFEGNARDDNGIQNLTINGQSVLLRPGKNVFFNYLTNLKQGSNEFLIVCTDPVGNKTEKKIVVNQKLKKVYEIGSRMSVIRLPFEKQGGGKDQGVEDAFHGSMIKSERFNIKEFGASLAKSPDPDTIKRLASEKGADFVIIGTITAKENSLQISARVIEAQSSETLTYEDVYAENIDDKLVKDLCQGLMLKLSDDLPIAEGQIVKVKEKEVIINVGEQDRIRKGMHIVIFDEGEALIDPKTGEKLGSDVEEYGTARIDKALPKMSYAQIIKTGDQSKLKAGQKSVTK